MSFIVVYVTHENEKEAKKIGDVLLDKKIIACYNLFPVSACYWWYWAKTDAHEVVSLLKTTKENRSALKDAVEKMHPYTVPCIMKFEVEANESYEARIAQETSAH